MTTHGADTNPEDASHRPTRAAEPPTSTRIAWELQGALPCIQCRYDLKGLSIRGQCPECGLAIRATLLAVVDPRAKEFEPLHLPRVTAVGMLAWAWGGLAYAVTVWWIRLNDFIGPAGASTDDRPAARLAALFLALSALGACTLIRPHARVEHRHSLFAVLGIAAYVPLIYFTWLIHGVMDFAHTAPYVEDAIVRPERIAARAALIASAVVVLLGTRPVARSLAARSLLIRTGRVDRQTMLAMITVLGVALLGDALLLLSLNLRGEVEGVARVVGAFLIAVGSALCTVGLVGVVIDVTRLAPVLVRPPPTLGALLGKDPGPKP